MTGKVWFRETGHGKKPVQSGIMTDSHALLRVIVGAAAIFEIFLIRKYPITADYSENIRYKNQEKHLKNGLRMETLKSHRRIQIP
ncbi:hypothetical protein, partial [Candidatus Symbiopectobacterium sp. NZEC135]